MSTADAHRLSLSAELCLTVGGTAMLTPRQAWLLVCIDAAGSLTEGAKRSGFSYRGAWNVVSRLSSLAGEPLVTASKGGKGGGFSRLTARGQRLLQLYAALTAQHAAFVDQLNQVVADFGEC